MILKREIALELGEALLDASENVKLTSINQNVVLINGSAVALPSDPEETDWEPVFTVTGGS